MKGPHPQEVSPAKASPVLIRQILAEPLEKLFAVSGSCLSTLLELDDAAADLPVSRGKDAI
jgi:hypothetical protein